MPETLPLFGVLTENFNGASACIVKFVDFHQQIKRQALKRTLKTHEKRDVKCSLYSSHVGCSKFLPF